MMKKLILYTLLGIISLIIVLLILLPFLAPTFLENNSKKWIGRSISIEKMRLNYFTGTLKLYAFNLYEKDDSTVFMAFDTLLVDTEPYQLFSNTLVVEQFYLHGMFMDVIMYDSAFNFDDLLALGNDSTSMPEQEPASDSEPMKFELSNLELSEAKFIIQDAEIQDSIEIRDFDFFLPYLAWNQEENSKADLKFDFKNEGYFESNLDYNPGNGQFDLDFILGNYEISGYRDFLAKYVDVGKFEGVIDFELNLNGNIEQPMQTTVSSNFHLNHFALYDDKDNVMIGTQKLSFDLNEANVYDKRILIDSIHILRPSLYLEAYDSTNNIAEFIKRVMPAEDTMQREEVTYETVSLDSSQQEIEMNQEQIEDDTAQTFFVSIRSILLDSGEVKLADYNNERSFEYEISDIMVMADSISSRTTWMNVEISMGLSDRGKMDSEIRIDLSNPKEMTLDFTISSLMLDDFDLYCRNATGYPLIYGDMYFKSHTDVRNDTIKSQNNIIVNNMKLGRREKVIGPPLKFAMFLLKDKDKVVRIDMPVEGPVGESATEIGKLVWDTFSKLLFKVVSTPFKFLGAIFNVLDTDIKRIKYDYMDSTFTDKMERQLNTLLKIEDHENEVKIDLVYYKDTLLERQQIAMDLIGKEYNGNRSRRNYKKDIDKFRKYVEKRVKTDTLSLVEACTQLADQTTVNSISALYDSARFQSLRNYLFSQRDTTEIMLYKSRDSAPNNEDRAPRFEVKLGMKDDYIEEKYIDKRKK